MSSTVFGEIPETWLGQIIRECRKIDMWLPWRERQAEHDCIVSKIKACEGEDHPFTSNVHLSDAVFESLGVAAAREKQIKRDPKLMTGSPHEVAARHIIDVLGIEEHVILVFKQAS